MATYKAMSLKSEFHETECQRFERLAIRAWMDSEASYTEVIRAVLRADPRPLPDLESWFSSTGPLWSARAAGKLLCLVRNPYECDYPHDGSEEQIAKQLTLVVIDLEAEGGGR